MKVRARVDCNWSAHLVYNFLSQVVLRLRLVPVQWGPTWKNTVVERFDPNKPCAFTCSWPSSSPCRAAMILVIPIPTTKA